MNYPVAASFDNTNPRYNVHRRHLAPAVLNPSGVESPQPASFEIMDHNY